MSRLNVLHVSYIADCVSAADVCLLFIARMTAVHVIHHVNVQCVVTARGVVVAGAPIYYIL